MKKVKHLLVSVLFALPLMAPLAITSAAHADEGTSDSGKLQCQYIQTEQIETFSLDNSENSDNDNNYGKTTTRHCDLAVDKQVSVNGGDYSEADSADQAASAQVGDTVQWKITVTNTSPLWLSPQGTVTVQDVLPAGLTFVNATPSVGTYSDGNWTFSVDGGFIGTPVTLVVTSTASTAGDFDNVASFTDYTPDGCNDPPYHDANSTNNTNSAFLAVAARPVVVPTTTTTPTVPKAPNTGFGVHDMNPVATSVVSTLGAASLIVLAYALRKTAARQ